MVYQRIFSPNYFVFSTFLLKQNFGENSNCRFLKLNQARILRIYKSLGHGETSLNDQCANPRSEAAVDQARPGTNDMTSPTQGTVGTSVLCNLGLLEVDEHRWTKGDHPSAAQHSPLPLPHPSSSRVSTKLALPVSRPGPPRPLCRHFLWVCTAEEKMAALGEPVRLERGECGGSRGRDGWGGSRLRTALPTRRSESKVAGALIPGTPPPSASALGAARGGRLAFERCQTRPFSLTVGTAGFSDLPTAVGTSTPWVCTTEGLSAS